MNSGSFEVVSSRALRPEPSPEGRVLSVVGAALTLPLLAVLLRMLVAASAGERVSGAWSPDQVVLMAFLVATALTGVAMTVAAGRGRPRGRRR